MEPNQNIKELKEFNYAMHNFITYPIRRSVKDLTDLLKKIGADNLPTNGSIYTRQKFTRAIIAIMNMNEKLTQGNIFELVQRLEELSEQLAKKGMAKNTYNNNYEEEDHNEDHIQGRLKEVLEEEYPQCQLLLCCKLLRSTFKKSKGSSDKKKAQMVEYILNYYYQVLSKPSFRKVFDGVSGILNSYEVNEEDMEIEVSKLKEDAEVEKILKECLNQKSVNDIMPMLQKWQEDTMKTPTRVLPDNQGDYNFDFVCTNEKPQGKRKCTGAEKREVKRICDENEELQTIGDFMKKSTILSKMGSERLRVRYFEIGFDFCTFIRLCS